MSKPVPPAGALWHLFEADSIDWPVPDPMT